MQDESPDSGRGSFVLFGSGCGFSTKFVRVSRSFFDGERARTLEISGNTKPCEGMPVACFAPAEP